MDFERWMDKVDHLIEERTGLDSSDLADIDYWYMWNEGASPSEAAKEALSNEGWDFS